MFFWYILYWYLTLTLGPRVQLSVQLAVTQLYYSRILEIFACGFRNPGLWNA